MNRLLPILERTRRDLARRQAELPLSDVRRAAQERLAADPPRDLVAALSRPGLSLIAEHKRRSPSAGVIREDVAIAEVVSAYERGGAAAVSVLTDGPSFGGSLQDLTAARDACSLPVLRKDFVLDPYQVHEALAFGADAVLLIVAALGELELHELHDLAGEMGLSALVEVHDAGELERARRLGAQLIGINNRDLATLEVDISRTHELLGALPAGAIGVAESGLRSAQELAELASAGVDAVLVGESLMRSGDIEVACRDLARAGRRTAPPDSARAV